MRITFIDSKNNVAFQYHKNLPEKKKKVKKKVLNVAALTLYGLYRNAVYSAYKEIASLATDIGANQEIPLATDIAHYEKQYQEPETSKLLTDPCYNDSLYHYAIAASLGTLQDWRDGMQSYIVYDQKTKIGFVNFLEKKIDQKVVVYIAQAGVLDPYRGKSIGRHLMECVLSHYPADTEFYIVTRVFNTKAISLYRNRLKFTPIDSEKIQQLGYDSRYCGFHHNTTASEIEIINSRKQVIHQKLQRRTQEAPVSFRMNP